MKKFIKSTAVMAVLSAVVIFGYSCLKEFISLKDLTIEDPLDIAENEDFL